MPDTKHDAGGKGRFPLPEWVYGDALFAGERQEHRIWLSRRRHGYGDTDPFALWCGMNPSTAAADEDDLTVRKEWVWTDGTIGYRRYVKVNAGSYRSTDPAGLERTPIISHPDNLPTIRRLAAEAAVIVLATGTPPNVLLPYLRNVLRTLKQDGRRTMCLGTTKDGWPKHSSRLAYSTPFVEYRL